MSTVEELLKLLDKLPMWKRISNAPSRIDELEKRIKALEDQISGTGEICPYCKKPSLELIEIKPDPDFGNAGLKRKYFKCNHCGKPSDKEIPFQ